MLCRVGEQGCGGAGAPPPRGPSLLATSKHDPRQPRDFKDAKAKADAAAAKTAAAAGAAGALPAAAGE